MSALSRRAFLEAGAAVGLAAATRPGAAQAPAVVKGSVKARVIASANGHQFKNGGPQTCVEKAWEMITQGEDVVEALVAGVTLVELDPEDTSVGYGGLPNAEGVVQLDAACMHGPRRRAGAVAALEGVRTPARVAQAVMDQTDHHLLTGAGAQAFARALGFPIEADLNSPRSRQLWLEWKRRTDPRHYLDPAKRDLALREATASMVQEGLLDPRHLFGTIHCSGLSARGELGGVTTTSGLAWKIPGRVGDSPILGAGLYVDNAAGAAGSTGRGEANLFNLSSFLIVEELRRGRHPKDAGLEALRRIKASTVEKRLRKPNGDPAFQVIFYVLSAKGEAAGVALYGEEGGGKATWPVRYAVCDEAGPRILPVEALLPGTPQG